MLAEELHRQADQIVEIHRLIGLQGRFVAEIGARRECFVFVGRQMARGLGGHQRVLPVGDDRLQPAQCRLVHGLRAVADDAGAVGRIEDREARLVAQRLGFLAQDAYAERVEGRDLQFVGDGSRQQLGHPLLHFLGRLVGEGDGGDIARLKAAVLHQIGDFLRDDARLARAGTGQHQQGAVEIVDCFALLGIEAEHRNRPAAEPGRAMGGGEFYRKRQAILPTP